MVVYSAECQLLCFVKCIAIIQKRLSSINNFKENLIQRCQEIVFVIWKQHILVKNIKKILNFDIFFLFSVWVLKKTVQQNSQTPCFFCYGLFCKHVRPNLAKHGQGITVWFFILENVTLWRNREHDCYWQAANLWMYFRPHL